MSADFDKALDRAVREMLDVEPPAGLRHRVIERLSAPGSQLPASRFPSLVASSFSWKILLPVAATAAVILAIVLTRGTPHQPGTRIAGSPQPVTAPRVPAPVQPSLAPEVPVTSVASGSQPAPERHVVAAAGSADVVLDAPPAPGFPKLPPLSVPELSVSSIQRLTPVEGPDAIATDPIATPSPLAIEPLPAQGRQSQE